MRQTLLVLAFLLMAAGAQAQVTYERLLKADQDPKNWMTYSGRYSGWRYSDLKQINAANAAEARYRRFPYCRC